MYVDLICASGATRLVNGNDGMGLEVCDDGYRTGICCDNSTLDVAATLCAGAGNPGTYSPNSITQYTTKLPGCRYS